MIALGTFKTGEFWVLPICDILIYLMWKAGSLSNNEIGQLFGVSYSAISHTTRSLKTRMRDDQALAAKLNQIYSQFKL